MYFVIGASVVCFGLVFVFVTDKCIRDAEPQLTKRSLYHDDLICMPDNMLTQKGGRRFALSGNDSQLLLSIRTQNLNALFSSSGTSGSSCLSVQASS
ncbi:hypothetical protein CDAR_562811 [Caerostris darwini]|uniref:Secreted protein n=1 Tax=Caerostris darwini TaxID=1538125 RepID=A0AAV4X5Q5_9ARAC|nr:hypothetical protein CDAR_562811 [Caerostris darwini]